ncbi:GNAT family N-acetyltransferase [Paenibacillus kandeliae]|uniref:GNAT family N-acetyltransferase n=1 Tax=Paenibacillus kandeliae TaxID=3231269 RepID=UPI00345A210D
MNITIRQTTAEDLHDITALMQEYIGGFYKKPLPATEQLHHLIRTMAAGQQGVQFILEQDGKAAGFATLYFLFSSMKAAPITNMNDLYVAEHLRDTEAEQQLFDACLAYTRDHDFAHMAWVAAPDNVRAQQFFERNGCSLVPWVDYVIQ